MTADEDFINALENDIALNDADQDNDDERETVEPAGQAPDEKPQQGETPPSPEPEVKPMFSDSAEFMVSFVGKIISRRISTQSGGGLRWDKDWWKYPEAQFRAGLMWRTFEVARADKDAGAMEQWARTVLDYHLGVLLNGGTGPMSNAGGPFETLGASYPPNHPKFYEHQQHEKRRREQLDKLREKEENKEKPDNLDA